MSTFYGTRAAEATLGVERLHRGSSTVSWKGRPTDAHRECWVVAAAVTRRAGTSDQRMPRRRRARWLPANRLGGRIAGRGVQVALHSSGRKRFTHEKNPLPRRHPRGFSRVPCPPATLSRTAGEKRAKHRPPPSQ